MIYDIFKKVVFSRPDLFRFESKNVVRILIGSGNYLAFSEKDKRITYIVVHNKVSTSPIVDNEDVIKYFLAKILFADCYYYIRMDIDGISIKLNRIEIPFNKKVIENIDIDYYLNYLKEIVNYKVEIAFTEIVSNRYNQHFLVMYYDGLKFDPDRMFSNDI